MIILTSPNGVYKVNYKTNEVEKILDGNFFGIAYQAYENILFLAERQDWGTLLRLFDLDDEFEEIRRYPVEEVEDAHQIAILNFPSMTFSVEFPRPIIRMTDTKKNRIVDIDYDGEIEVYNIGDEEKDINHINAVNFSGYIGLNNKGNECSKVIRPNNKVISLEGVYHSHDIEYYCGDILVSASHQGFVYSLNKKEPLFYTGDVWTRGLCVSKAGVWVGYSAVSPRSSRQDPTLKNSINLFSHCDFKHIKQIVVDGCGQINDMVYIED